MAAWETEKEAEMQRLKRHQRVLDKQSRALLKLPNRKERSEVHINVPLSGLQVRICTRQCQDALACASQHNTDALSICKTRPKLPISQKLHKQKM